MDKQLKLWIDVLEHTNINSEALNELIQDMKRAQKEAERHIRICDRCTENKFVQENICKQCAHALRPLDTEI